MYPHDKIHGIGTRFHRLIVFTLILFMGLLMETSDSVKVYAQEIRETQETAENYFTLSRAVGEALSANLGIKSSREETRAAMARKEARRSYFLPTLSAYYKYTRNDEEFTSPGIGVLSPLNEFTLSAGFSQTLFSGFSLVNRYKIAKLGVASARIQEGAVRQDIVLGAKNAFFSMLKAQKHLKIARETVTQIEAQKNDAENFYNVGMTPRNDLLQAQVELANANQELVIAGNDLETARAVFNTLLRRPINSPVNIEDIEDYTSFTPDIEYCLETALKSRPELRVSELEVEIAQKELKVSQKDYYPTINLEGTYIQQGDDWDAKGGLGSFGEAYSWDISAVASWDFFEWGKTYYGVEEQLRKLSKAKFNQSDIQDNIRLEVKRAYLKMRQSEKNISTVKLAIEQARENYRINTERYKEQVASSTDVLDAQTLLSRTMTNYYNALYDYKIAKATLYRAMGVLDPADRQTP